MQARESLQKRLLHVEPPVVLNELGNKMINRSTAILIVLLDLLIIALSHFLRKNSKCVSILEPLRCQYLLLSGILYHCKLNTFGF